MRTAFLCFVLPMLSVAQIQVEVMGATATQAVIQVRGATSPCTIELREGGPNGPVHPDVMSSVDTSRPDTITWKDGVRLVTLGHQRSNLALAADTDYHGAISGCGTANFRFHTAVPATGATMPPPMPFDCAKPDCLDYPTIDWNLSGRNKWYTDPLTGVKSKPLVQPGDMGRSHHDSEQAFPYWAGGTDWTTPANAANGGTATFAAVSGTQPLFLYPTAGFDPYADYSSVENIGVVVYGSATGSAADDRTIDICITKDPAGQVCSGTAFSVVLPSGSASPASVAKVSGGSSHSNAGGAYPTGYPHPFFSGWGTLTLRRDEWSQASYAPGTVTSVANGVASIATPTGNSHFQKWLRPGNHIYVQDSGCSAAGAPNVCAVATFSHAGLLTLSETGVNVSEKQFIAFPFGIMVKKRNANGTASVGFRFKFAGSGTVGTSPEYVKCSSAPAVTSVDGVQGRLCYVGAGSLGLYFVSTDGETVRRLAIPGSPSGMGAQFHAQKIAFSPTQSNVIYATDYTGSGYYKLTYMGNYRDSVWDAPSSEYWIKPGGDYPRTGAAGALICPTPTRCEDIEWSLALSDSVNNQITAKYPQFNSAPWSSWSSGVSFAGITGDLMVLSKTVSGVQDAGPCHIAVFSLATGSIIDMFSTLEPANKQGFGGGCHGVQVSTTVPNYFAVSQNLPNGKNGSLISAGPFHMPILAVRKTNGSWSTTQGLPWPVNADYDSACPAGLAADYSGFGAVNNQCATLKVRPPCNIAPHTTDITLYGPCPWNAAYSLTPGLYPGNKFVDYNFASAATVPPGVSVTGAWGDAEQFRVLPGITDNGDGTLTIIVQRNASRDYCCASTGTANPAGNDCGVGHSGAMNYMNHPAQFTAAMVPGTKGTCNAVNIGYWYADGTATSKQVIDMARSYYAGHTTTGRAPNGGYTYIGGTKTYVMSTLTDMEQYPVQTAIPTEQPKFNGVSAGIGSSSQSYPNATHILSSPAKLSFAFDWNHINPSYGQGASLSSTMFPARTLTSVTGDIWLIQPSQTVDYKNRPLLGWMGPFLLKDVSAPAPFTITAAPDNAFCYAYKAGECYPGSTQGQVYLKAKNVYPHGACTPGQYFANVPCVYSAAPVMGWARQYRSTRADALGRESRLLSTAFKVPGTHAAYLALHATATGELAISAPGGWVQGVRSTPWILKLPSFPENTAARNTLGGLKVNIGGRTGVTHARVRFGHNTSFFCTERSEACVTDSTLKPFAFVSSDTLTPIPCSGGCTIEVPAVPGRLVYYRVETYNGSSWDTTGDTMAATP